MNIGTSRSSDGRYEVKEFIHLLNTAIRDSKIYFPDSYYYEDLIGDKKRLDDFVNQLCLISASRTFDNRKLTTLYENQQDLVLNAILHKNEDLYFDAIYSMFDNLLIRLIEISKFHYNDIITESTNQCDPALPDNKSKYYINSTRRNAGVIFLYMC